eukprot:c9953_g1_i1 orf=165-2552(-)
MGILCIRRLAALHGPIFSQTSALHLLKEGIPSCVTSSHLPKVGIPTCVTGNSIYAFHVSSALASSRTLSHLPDHNGRSVFVPQVHGFSPHAFRVNASSVFKLCRSFSVAVAHAQHLHGEPTKKTDAFSDELPTEKVEEGIGTGSEKRVRLPPEVSVEKFFVRGRAIANIVDLLKKGVSEDELQEALRGLPVAFDNLLVTQVLRVDLPCDIALKFFHWLTRQHGFQHNEYTYGVMLNNLGRAGRLDEMQELFDDMKSKGCSVTRVTLSNVMRWFYKAKDMRRVAHHWNTLRRAGIKPSAAIYTAYIDFLVRANRHTKIAIIFEEMLRLDCLPNSRTYTVFIEHLVNAGNVEAAAKIMSSMHTMRVVPSRVAYKIVINGFARIGNAEMVLENLREMRENFHRPTKQLMPAVTALQAAGKLEEASMLLEEIQPDSPPQSIDNATQLLDEEDADDVECVTTVWRSASCSHLVFDVSAFVDALYAWNPRVEKALEQASLQWESSLVMGILRRLRNLESLWPFFHWLKDKVGFKHDTYSCAVLVQRILKSRSPMEKMDFLVKELFEGLQRDGMRFSVPLFNLVIRHYIAVGEAEKACNMFHMIKDFGLNPNGFSYALVIQGFAKNRQGKKATAMLKETEEHGFLLDSSTSAELITCLGLAGKIERAYALFCKMLESGRKPGRLEYKSILATYFRVGDNGMALKLYEDMRKAGIAPTQDMYDVVTGILRKACRLSDIQVLAEERRLLNFFDGNKKVLQESLLQVLFAFMEGLKPRKSQKACRFAYNQEGCVSAPQEIGVTPG